MYGFRSVNHYLDLLKQIAEASKRGPLTPDQINAMVLSYPSLERYVLDTTAPSLKAPAIAKSGIPAEEPQPPVKEPLPINESSLESGILDSPVEVEDDLAALTSKIVAKSSGIRALPIIKYKPHLVMKSTDAPITVNREIVGYNDSFKDVEIEVTEAGNTVIIRAGSEGLYSCQDFGGVLIGNRDMARAVAIGDGVGSCTGSQIVCYHVIEDAIRQAHKLHANGISADKAQKMLFNGIEGRTTLTRKVIIDMLSEYANSSKPFSGFARTTMDIITGEGLGEKPNWAGATTALLGIIDEQHMYFARIGDGGILLIGDDGLKYSEGFHAGSNAPDQIGIFEDWFLCGEVKYSSQPYSHGNIAAFFTDGCLKRGYNTPESLGNILYELRTTHSDLKELGLALFKEAVGTPKRSPIYDDKSPKLSDDAILTLVRL